MAFISCRSSLHLHLMKATVVAESSIFYFIFHLVHSATVMSTNVRCCFLPFFYLVFVTSFFLATSSFIEESLSFCIPYITNIIIPKRKKKLTGPQCETGSPAVHADVLVTKLYKQNDQPRSEHVLSEADLNWSICQGTSQFRDSSPLISKQEFLQ